MPELPEVETIVRGLRNKLIGRLFRKIDVRCPQIIEGNPHAFAEVFVDKEIEAVERHGKNIFISFSCPGALPPPVLNIHLGMTGQLLFKSVGSDADRYTHVVFHLDNGPAGLHYRDIRKFGWLRRLENAQPTSMAPDAWKAPKPELYSALRARMGMIKHALLDQHVIAGLGNIYVDESLFDAGIHPRRQLQRISNGRLERLINSINRVLAKSIQLGGTSFRNYVDTNGGRGGFKERLNVYGKGGQPCPSCRTALKRTVVCSRGTHYCPRCQK